MIVGKGSGVKRRSFSDVGAAFRRPFSPKVRDIPAGNIVFSALN